MPSTPVRLRPNSPSEDGHELGPKVPGRTGGSGAIVTRGPFEQVGESVPAHMRSPWNTVNGVPTDPKEGGTDDRLNPSTGETVARMPVPGHTIRRCRRCLRI